MGRRQKYYGKLKDMKLYSTVMRASQTEQTIEKSKFICYIAPVSSKEEADLFIQEVRKKHKDATHNVPAMVIGDKMQIQWASDDGEPQGTSGAPIVQMLVNMELTNVVVVVTRYFGGIKLGPGGLVRAYTSSAQMGIEKAGIGDVEEYEVISYEIDYTYLQKIQNLAGETFFVDKVDYLEKVCLDISFLPEDESKVFALLNDITKGTGNCKKTSKKLLTKER